MARAWVGVGANLDAERNVRAAVRALGREARVVAVSSFYRTAPIGNSGDPWFINGVVAVETDRPAAALKRDVLRRIEEALGRRRVADENAPRPIDLDLLLYEHQASREGGIELPDPDIAARPFLAWPLAELGAELPDGRPVSSLAEHLPRDGMIPLPELTAALREEVERG